MTDMQWRNLPAKVNDALEDAHHVSQQLNEAAVKVSTTLNKAFGPDHYGENVAQNISDSRSNVNAATANMAEDTESLKHEFFFRSFFNKPGFYNFEGSDGRAVS